MRYHTRSGASAHSDVWCTRATSLSGADDSTVGLDEARRVLKKRGRWLSDIAHIYARTSLDTSLEASARLADVTGRDVEAAFSGWAEPAT